MKLSEAGELTLLEILRKRFDKKSSRLVHGIGDDAAVIRPANTNMLITTDMMVEGVHFELGWTTPFQLGFKLVSVNVSDIYAMGGSPEFLLLNFSANGNFELGMFNGLFNGIEKALDFYNISLIGGDVSSSDKIVLSATAIGYAAKPLFRSGARVGDRIYVTGCLGDSACGLKIMKKINRPVEIEKGKKAVFALRWNSVLPLIRRHLMPGAVRPDKFLRRSTSMIDVSDGLLLDLSRICRESRVGAKIYSESVPISKELIKAAEYFGMEPLELALSGGEDYELLFTAPEGEKIDAFCIGEITSSGIKLVDKAGRAGKISIRGYQHFAA